MATLLLMKAITLKHVATAGACGAFVAVGYMVFQVMLARDQR